ncbi:MULTISPECIES: RAMP superfamily CRISPR-associated protein [Leptolyngbya]|uniref:RAMP superfamily CRISPR-associated protein n=1 Tax=Leptolyngbya TaxID=47251 RepID=UPI001686D4EF|nr:RAMP superfamily CRISPR-associated protein [Leptolyngbya sp. FACHB-1624]MBD1858243.1 hypothetical protein [Leptolyngbya sp. FACHB-1624]
MARPITKRLKIQGVLTAETPLHIGGLESNVNVDLALAVDGQGRYYISGTSLAGALRSWMQDFFDDQCNQLWGDQSGNKGHASFVIVEDALISTLAPIEIRDGVGIDRRSGTAADKSKYNRAILPKGTTFPLALTIEIQDSTEIQSAIEALLDALCAGMIRLGAAKTRGLGKVKLSEPKLLTETLAGKANLLKVLKNKLTDDLDFQSYQPKPPRILPHLTIEIDWSPVDAVMVKAEQDGIAVDILPFVSSVNQLVALTIPGSSIKGSLRSQAERIVRTVKSYPSQSGFLQQVEVPIVTELFGVAARPHSNLGLGALTADDCYSTTQLQQQDWEKIESAEDSQTLVEALTPLANTKQAFHVAVDRWTGGAADNMLYSNLEPFGITWEPICLTVQLNRLADQNLAIALLLFTLRDLIAGRIPLGYGANRGLGAIKVNHVVLQGYELSGELQSFNQGVKFTAIETLDSALLQQLDQHWQAWMDSTEGEVA